MPDGLVPDDGLARGLQWTLDNPDTQLDAWQLLLFVNDYTPDESTTMADLVEASFGGYNRVALMPNDWSAPVVVAHVATSTWGSDPVEFTNTTGPTQTVYGCAYLDPVFNVLRFVQRFDAGDVRPIAAGANVLVIPRLTRRGKAP